MSKTEDKKSVTGIIEDLFGPENAQKPQSEQTEDLGDTKELPTGEKKDVVEVEEPTADISIKEEKDSSEENTEEIKIFSSKPGRKKKQEHSPFMREDDTAPIDMKPGKSMKVSIGHPLTEEEEEDNGQLSFDEWNASEEVEDVDLEETSPEGDLELVHQFRESRENKVRSFKLKLDGEEEQNDSEEDVEEFEEEYVDDFITYEDAEAVSSELKYRASKNTVTLLVTAIWEFLLLLASFCFHFGIFSDPLAFIIGTLIVFIIMIGFNWDIFRDGFADIKENAFGTESAVCIVSAISILHTIASLANMDMVISFGLTPVLAGFGILCLTASRRIKLARINQNFDVVSKEDKKWAATIIDNEKAALEVGGATVATGIPRVSFFRPVDFIYKFLTVSYDRRPEFKRIKYFIPALWIVSLVLASVFGLIEQDWWTALNVFGISFCLSVPVSLPFSIEGALHRASHSSLKAGGMMTGRNAVDRFGRIDAVCVDAAELFPSDNVLLHGIKTFVGTRIDEAILDAAAVVIAAGGPLAGIFRRVIEDKVNMLQEVDTLVYEQDMGLSGWVGGKRVLVGNRKLLENHGVDVPSNDYEARYRKNDRELVYLSVAGQLSAMFVVSYLPNEDIGPVLQKLTHEDVTLLIHTCDPNINEKMIANAYDLNPYYVEILTSTSRRRFGALLQEQMEEDTVTECVAELCCNNTLTGKVIPLIFCSRLRKMLPIVSTVAILLSIIGLLLPIIYVFAIGSAPFTPWVLAYMILSAFIVGLTPLFNKV